MEYFVIFYCFLMVSVLFFCFREVYKITESSDNLNNAIKKTYIIGIFFFTIIFSWILTSYPLEYIGFHGFTSVVLLLLYFVVTIGVASLTFLMFPFIFLGVSNNLISTKIKSSIFFHCILFGTLFTLFGYILSLVFYILYFSFHLTFGWYWIFADPALLFIFTPFSLFLPYIGLSGVNFAIGFIIPLVSRLGFLKSTATISLFFIFSAVFIFTNKEYTHNKIITPSVTATSTEGSFLKNGFIISTSRYLLISPKDIIKKEIMLYGAHKENLFYLVPEDVGFDPSILLFIKKQDSKIIFGSSQYIGPKHYNALFYYDPSLGSPIALTEKRFLIPFGEYVPSFFKFTSALFLSHENLNTILKKRTRDSGTGLREIAIDGELYVVGLCSDFWSREGISFARASQAKKAIAFESNSFFRNNKWFLINLYAWHTFFAKATGKVLISVPNDSPIWIIDGRK